MPLISLVGSFILLSMFSLLLQQGKTTKSIHSVLLIPTASLELLTSSFSPLCFWLWSPSCCWEGDVELLLCRVPV